MKMRSVAGSVAITTLLLGTFALAQDKGPKQKSFDAPNGLKVTVAMVSPVAAQVDLQVVTVLEHKASGDAYIEAWKEFDDKVGNVVSALRDRGDFVGELGETIDFLSPPGSIAAKRILLVGLGDEKTLSLDSLRVAGRVAVREAIRLHAKKVSFAPALRDQGSSVIDVGDGDRAFAENVVLAYATERRLQSEGLAEDFEIDEWTLDAGPAYFDAVAEKVGEGVSSTAEQLGQRERLPYRKAAK
jgi:hypothetical protein